MLTVKGNFPNGRREKGVKSLSLTKDFEMARPLRIQYEDAVYHVTCRGNERKAIYRDDHDRHLFLEL
ncbi:MAG: hypothetical protein IT451_09415, partial [Candidatus Brocadia sp.]|nr:hypothetical protein [Candidatus Brocadia sp.]